MENNLKTPCKKCGGIVIWSELEPYLIDGLCFECRKQVNIVVSEAIKERKHWAERNKKI